MDDQRIELLDCLLRNGPTRNLRRHPDGKAEVPALQNVGFDGGPCRAEDGIVDSAAADIVYSNYFTGIHGNYLKGSIRAMGMDPDKLPEADPSKMNFAEATSGPKAWKEIWGSGQGIGAVKAIESAASLIDRLDREYRAAKARICGG